MKLINTATNQTICELIVNHSISLDDAIILAGGETINDMYDDNYSDDGDNIIIDGVRYWLDDLAVIY